MLSAQKFWKFRQFIASINFTNFYRKFSFSIYIKNHTAYREWHLWSGVRYRCFPHCWNSCLSIPPQLLFYSYRLCQIPWTIHIVSSEYSNMIRQELHGDDSQDTLQHIRSSVIKLPYQFSIIHCGKIQLSNLELL